MRRYKFTRSTGYEMINLVDDGAYDILWALNGTPQRAHWKPIRVRRVRVSRREGFKPSDSPYRGGETLIFRRSAIDALRDMLDAHGELLPLVDEDGVELHVFNPRVLDALDQEKSDGSRDENGRISIAHNHVFIPSIVDGVDIFRVKEGRVGEISLSERFLQRWKQAKLKGLDFILAWDSELPPDQQPNVWTSKPVKL